MRPGSSNIMTLDELENFRGMETEVKSEPEAPQLESETDKKDEFLL